MATPAFAIPSLELLLQNNYNIETVVTVPDKQKGRGLHFQESDIKKFALNRKLKILQPENLSDKNFIQDLENINPDLIIIVAFRILPVDVFNIPKYGSINLHASLLPRYRGAAPINWAIINGEKETGVTTFFIKEKVDTGDILVQKKIPIEDSDDAGSLHDKLALLGASALLQTVKQIESGNLFPIKQDELLSSKAPKLNKENCKIKWNEKSLKIHNLIRGVSPYPASYTKYKNKIIKIFKSSLTNIQSFESPGNVYIENKNLYVNTEDNLLEVLELQAEGKKRVTALDFINGLGTKEGIQFE